MLGRDKKKTFAACFTLPFISVATVARRLRIDVHNNINDNNDNNDNA